MPLLVWRPGELTRRYIDGERARFVSPMALFLFTVFAMFAVFSFQGGGDVSDIARSQSGHQAAIETTDRQLADLRARVADPGLTSEQRAAIEEEIADLEFMRAVTQAFFFGDRDGAKIQDHTAEGDRRRPDLPRAANQVLERLNENPGLLLYKLKTNGYKFSWALVPMSIPFVWLLFFWRRDIHLYDHAIFVTYSISFMMLLVILASLLGAAGVGTGFLQALFMVPPVHIYRQLRGAYGLSRTAAFVRTFLVLISATIVLGVFITLLLLVGGL